jgi:hypothetical protein
MQRGCLKVGLKTVQQGSCPNLKSSLRNVCVPLRSKFAESCFLEQVFDLRLAGTLRPSAHLGGFCVEN